MLWAMSRPLRIELADGLYHVTSRGDRREAIDRDAQDRRLGRGTKPSESPSSLGWSSAETQPADWSDGVDHTVEKR
jgi:hypothetical protein